MAVLSPHLSIITLNINGLNSPIKRHRAASWIKNKTQLYAASRRPTPALKTNIGSKRGYGRWYYKQIAAEKKVDVAILISDKIDFKPKMVIRNKEGHYTIIKGSKHHEIQEL